MSLSVDGFWKAGFWAETFWADGFWREGAAPEPEVVTALAGSGRRYPRWAVVQGKRYRVRSHEEERALLQSLVAQVQEVEDLPAAEVQKQVKRLVRRIKAVEQDEDQWIKVLKSIDEELLILVH